MCARIHNSLEIIRSTNIIARIGVLERMESRTIDESRELASLKYLAQQGSQLSDLWADKWCNGVTLFADSYFVVHAQNIASKETDCTVNQWPLNCVDWQKAARELQAGYFRVNFDGVAYWIRS
jgi:hypothetical protein